MSLLPLQSCPFDCDVFILFKLEDQNRIVLKLKTSKTVFTQIDNDKVFWGKKSIFL